jgi:rubrerythrin
MTGSASFTYLLARLTAPFAFAGARRTARHLFTFAQAEHESMLELRAAAAACTVPERRAAYLRHALDEQRHATMFALHSAELMHAAGEVGLGHPVTGTESLFARLGETRFLAFVHRGERKGRTQFEAYRDHFARRGNDKLRALFAALIVDELEHERYTLALLVETTKDDPTAAAKAARRIAAWEAMRAWRRAGQGLSSWVYTTCMYALYLSLAPFALLARAKAPHAPGALTPPR